MILQSLVACYESLAARDEEGLIPRYGFARQKIGMTASLAPDGTLLALAKLVKTETDRSGKLIERPRDDLLVPIPFVKASGIKANFLCDTANYLFGFDRQAGADPKGRSASRARECFEASKALHIKALSGATGETACAIRAFFLRFDPDEPNEEIARSAEALASGVNILFRVNGLFASEDEECRQCWLDYKASISAQEKMQCLVTGKTEPIAVLHDKIKGIRGGQSFGTTLVGFNSASSESFGREQGMNAPVSEYAAFAYATALNHLLNQPRRCMCIGGITIVYWSASGDDGPVDLFATSMGNPYVQDTDGQLNAALTGMMAGKPVTGIDTNEAFYVLALAPNGGRLVTRFFLRSTLGDTLDNIRDHYLRMKLVHARYEHDYLMPYWALDATVNPNAKDKTPSAPLSAAYMRSMLMGQNYSESLHQAIHTRIRAERSPSYPRVALLKAYLLKNKGIKEVELVALNPEWKDKAYLLGRLFSMLEDLQIDSARPAELKSTIKDRYFTSACATPAPIFPQLLKLKEHHLRKCDQPVKIKYSKAIGQLMDMFEASDDTFPKHLSLTEQDKFILGYYHQSQRKYTSKTEKEGTVNE